MKKGFLIVALCSIIGYLCGYGYVNASSEVLSNSYTSLLQCTLDKDKFNTEFPDYVRSSCFLKEGNYYYTLCQKGSTCTTQSSSASLDYTLGNPYSSKISSSLKVKLDTVITALENKKKTENPSVMNGYLDTFLVKINSLKVKYNGKTAILDMLAYLEYETNRIKSELQQGSDENSTSDFFCDLMGECSKTATSTSRTAQATQTAVSQYPGCNAPDIVLSNGQVWSACNVGSSISGTGSDSYGNIYKWGNNTPGSSSNWLTLNPDLAGWANGVGPCAAGYKIGTKNDWDATYNLLNNNYNELIKKLLIPMAGYGRSQAASVGGTVTSDMYRFAANIYTYLWLTEKNLLGLNHAYTMSTSTVDGFPVRCIKSTVQGTQPSVGTQPIQNNNNVINPTVGATPTNFGTCNFTGVRSLYYGENCISAKFSCTSGLLLRDIQFSPSPAMPTSGQKTFSSFDSCKANDTGAVTEPQSYVNNRPPAVSNTQSLGTLNGGVCRGEMVYVNTIGVNKSNPPKGCASPASSNDCLQVSNHRSFENSEWTTNGIITTNLHTKDIPAGEYSFYTSYGNIIKKTGTVKVNSCDASKYTWSCSVVGGTIVNTSGNICNASNVGENKKINNHDCTCAFNGSGNYDSTVSIPTTPVVNPNPSPSTSPVVNPNPNPNIGQTTCDGTLPTGAGIESSPYTNITAGGGSTSNTTWMYIDDARNINKVGCTWICKAGFTRSGNSCVQKASGSGLKIEVVDMDGNPLSGVNIEVIGSILSAGSLVLASVTTDANGTVPEIFVNKFGVLQLLKITKAGYYIASASGCRDRVTSGINYCDDVALENSSVKIYLSSATVVKPLSGTMYVSQKNSLTYNVSGLTQTNGQFCLEVLAHIQQHQSAINTGNCNDASKYTPFSEFPGAYYRHTMWILPVPYNESIFGVEGIQVRVFVKNTTTGNVVSFDLFTKN